jgi:hypothetical protein
LNRLKRRVADINSNKNDGCDSKRSLGVEAEMLIGGGDDLDHESRGFMTQNRTNQSVNRRVGSSFKGAQALEYFHSRCFYLSGY